MAAGIFEGPAPYFRERAVVRQSRPSVHPPSVDNKAANKASIMILRILDLGENLKFNNI